MKALVVEDEPLWRKEIALALQSAIPSLVKTDIMPCADPEAALRCLEGSDGWQYRLIVLDWGFVTGTTIATAEDLAAYIHTKRKDAFVILLTGGDEDKRMTKHRDVMKALFRAKAAERILKSDVSKNHKEPDSKLPKLATKLKELKLEEKLRQNALFRFKFQDDFISGTVDGEQFTFPPRTAIIVKLLYERRLNNPPGVVTKALIEKTLADNGHKSTVDRSDWKVTEEFKNGDPGKFKKFLEWEVGGLKGHYRLSLPEERK